MTDERTLVYLHKMLHEDAKHRQDDLKDLQETQVSAMKVLLSRVAIEDAFADFCKNYTPEFLAEAPNTCPGDDEVAALRAMEISALDFPCIRIADNGKTAKGMWLAQTAAGPKAIAAQFLRWGEEWKLWKLILAPGTDDLPADSYARCYPDPKEKPLPPKAAGFGGPGGPGGPGDPGGSGGPGGPGGPGGGEDAPPFDPDARSDVFDIESNYARLTSDIGMLNGMAMPDFKGTVEAADLLMEQCRKAVSPAYVAERVHRIL